MRIPQSTYRLQFNAGFTFSDAKKITDYLYELGISDIYASPVFRAKTKSAHGYDVVDPSQINPELGTFEEFKEGTLAVREKSMGWIQDFVPNHMSYSSENPYVMDLFENGRNSRYFDFFDINWDHPDTAMSGRVLAPFLGSFYDEALSNGEIKL